jgi:hypothetical protein
LSGNTRSFPAAQAGVRRFLWVVLILGCLMAFAACLRWEPVDGGAQMPENDLITDPHDNFTVQTRIYNLGYLLRSRNGLPKAKHGTDLGTMKRFLFQYHPGGMEASSGFGFVLDRRSNRVYSGGSVDAENPIASSLIADLNEEDISRLVTELERDGFKNWVNTVGIGEQWAVCVEFEDGTIMQRFGGVTSARFEQLFSYLKKESDTYLDRMLKDRKTTLNVDYLVAYQGHDPGYYEPMSLSPRDWVGIPLSLEGIERVMFFEAEEPHAVHDHSRSPQKTLLFDFLNGEMYYEPEKTVYEDISKAALAQPIGGDTEVQVIQMLESSKISEWKKNKLYSEPEQLGWGMGMSDIPAWCIAFQYDDGRILHFSGDGIGEGGKPEGVDELLDSAFALVR